MALKKRKLKVYKNDYKSIEEMSNSVRSVLKSLTDKDGHYGRKEAETISNLFGKQVSLMKVKLDAYKIAGGNITTVQKLLS